MADGLDAADDAADDAAGDVFQIGSGWLVWWCFADHLNWESFVTLPEAVAEAAEWERQGLEVGIQWCSSGTRLDLTAAAIQEPGAAVLP